MNNRFVSIVVLGVLGVATLLLAGLPLRLAQPQEALGQAVPQTMRTLHAFFTSTDSAGIVTDVDINATIGPDGGEATIEVSRYRPTCENNGCPQVLSHSFNRVPLAAGELQVTGALDKATLRTTRRVRERLANNADSVTIDLNWRAVGQVVQDHHEEGELFRHARATGSIRAGGINFTPKAAIEAQIEEW